MRVVMLSWEYPPRIVGGIARHVEELTWALAERGDEIHVITCDHPGAPAEENVRGVHVHRVSPACHASDFVHWLHLLNGAMHARADRLLQEWIAPDEELRKRNSENGILLHAHDWLVHFCARELKHEFKIPLIATIHATEHGRNNGIHTALQRSIASTEWELSYEAWRVIVCSAFMQQQVTEHLELPPDKIDVIPNGVRASKFDFDFSPEEAGRFRAQFARLDEQLVFFVGRMVAEKGAHLLLEAFSKARKRIPTARLLIVGGGDTEPLKQLAEKLTLGDHVTFTGFVPDDVLLRLYRVIDVAAFPSLYEPFGIVALEAMAACVPVIVSDAGGFPEVVEHNVTGIVFPRGDSDALADAIVGILRDPARAHSLADNGLRRVHDHFNWDRLAARTHQVYEQVWEAYRQCDW